MIALPHAAIVGARRAVERAGLARAAVVVGDERVPGEESAPVRGLQAEVERLRGGLARPAGEHDHHAARLADRRELLDVERHLAGGGVRVVERDAQRRADEAVVTAERKRRLRGRRPALRPARRALRRGGGGASSALKVAAVSPNRPGSTLERAEPPGSAFRHGPADTASARRRARRERAPRRVRR